MSQVDTKHGKIDTGSGSVDLGLLSATPDLDIDTGSGHVSVSVPQDFSARLHLETGSGGIRSDLPVTIEEKDHGTLRGFHNICLHRAGPVAHGCGKRQTLQCRYHGWTYDLQGRFVTAPAPVAPRDPASANNHLRALPTSVMAGLIFFSLAQSPSPASLGEAGELIAKALGDKPHHSGAISTEIGCNWKTYFEHALATGSSAWAWPLVLAREYEGAIVLEQVVPRTFLRTRVIRHVLVCATGSVQALESLRAGAEASKAQCEALQAERAAGTPANATGRIADLHARLAAACAADPGA
jgi:nitrite reductase/ring-hydroxylating ferredoxin subunit